MEEIPGTAVTWAGFSFSCDNSCLGVKVTVA